MKVLRSSDLKICLNKALSRLEEKKEAVNRLNVFPVPDGDTGTNMNLTVKSAVETALDVKEERIDKILQGLSKGALMGARGNSGVILSQIFRGFAEGLEGVEEADSKRMARGFVYAAKKAYKAVMKPTEGTILTVAKDMANHAEKSFSHSENLEDFFNDVIKAGKISLDKTPEKLSILKEAGVVDSGGAGLLVFWEGFYEGISGEVIDYFSDFQKSEISSDYKYEVSFYTDEPSVKNTVLKDYEILSEEGDKRVKYRIGSNDLGVLFNDLRNIEIYNISIKTENDTEESKNDSLKEKMPLKDGTGMIAVSPGEGISAVFKDLGVSEVISGGQTMNPSTEDFLKAIEAVPYKKIIILPNNKNIIMAANQAGEISEREVAVIPTLTIPQGISSAIAFDFEAELSENKENMTEAIETVKTGQVTYSIRDISINGLNIKKDDIMGIMEGEIVDNGKDINEISLNLLKKMTDEDSSMATIIYGEDIDSESATKLEDLYKREFPDMHVEIINGKQGVYYYILSVE